MGFFSYELDRIEREITRERKNDALRLDEGLRIMYADEKPLLPRPFNPNKVRQIRRRPKNQPV